MNCSFCPMESRRSRGDHAQVSLCPLLLIEFISIQFISPCSFFLLFLLSSFPFDISSVPLDNDFFLHISFLR